MTKFKRNLIKCILFVFTLSMSVYFYLGYDQLSIFYKVIFYCYLTFLAFQVLMLSISIQEYHLGRIPVTDELSYQSIQHKIDAFPELRKIGQKHLTKTRNGETRLSVLGMNKINSKFDELDKQLVAERELKTKKKINDLVSDLFEPAKDQNIESTNS